MIRLALTLAFAATLSLAATTTAAPIPEPEWVRTFDPHGNYVADVASDPDGEAYVIGESSSEGNPYGDVRLSRYDAGGERTWTRVFGRTGKFIDRPVAVAATEDAVYTVADTARRAQHGTELIAVNRFALDGTPIWRRLLAIEGHETGAGIAVAPDGSLVVAGTAMPPGEGPAGFVTKLSPDGRVEWRRLVPSPTNTILFFASAVAVSGSGDVYLTVVNGYSERDVTLAKWDAAGRLLFRKVVLRRANVNAIIPAPGGGLYFAGSSGSGDVDGFDEADALFGRISAAGAVAWTRTIGGADGDRLFDIAAVDRGLVLAGSTDSPVFEGNVTKGDSDIVVMHVSSQGKVRSLYVKGGPGPDTGIALALAPARGRDGVYLAGRESRYTPTSERQVPFLARFGP